MVSKTLSHRSVHANGIAFHVALAGAEDRPLVVLLHGFPECWYAWRHQVDALVDAGFRVAMPDQRGYGTSSKPARLQDYHVDVLADDVIALAKALGHADCSVVGHDWGGIVAWQVAARFPRQVHKLVILNAPRLGTFASFMLRHPGQWFKSAYVGFFQLPVVPEMTLSANSFFGLKQALKSSSRAGTFTPQDLEVYEQAWSEPGALTGMLNWYRAMGRAEGEPSRIVAPTLVLWGDRDSALEAGLAEAAVGLCDDGRVVHLSDATHWLHHEEPALVNAELTRFLARAS